MPFIKFVQKNPPLKLRYTSPIGHKIIYIHIYSMEKGFQSQMLSGKLCIVKMQSRNNPRVEYTPGMIKICKCHLRLSCNRSVKPL